MSFEKIAPSDPEHALKSYGAAIPLLSKITSELVLNAAPSSSGRSNLLSFTQYRELWRWVERLLWRAVTISSRISNIYQDGSSPGNKTSIWTWFKHYSACCVYWPPSFRTAHRSTISVLYLRAFILRYSPSSDMSLSTIETQQKAPAWLSNARSVINDYRAVLNVSTSFPCAGERNVKVEDFVDLCVGVWEASGARGDSTGWANDVSLVHLEKSVQLTSGSRSSGGQPALRSILIGFYDT